MKTFDSFAQELANVLNKRLNKEFKTLKTDSDGFINDDNIQLSFDNRPFADGLFFAEIYVKNVDRLFIVTYHKDNTFTLQENLDNGTIIYLKENSTLNEILNLLDSILLNKKSSQTCLDSLQFNQAKALLLSMQILYSKGFANESDSLNILLDDFLSKASGSQYKELKEYQDYIINRIDNNEF